MALSRSWGMASTGEALTLPGSISKTAAQHLPGAAEVLMKTTYGLLEDCIVSAIEKRNAADFSTWRNENFSAYFNAVLGLPSLMKFVVPPHVIERLNREFFNELEADLRDKGIAQFGAAVRDQAMFTAWTLRKITDLISQFPSSHISLSEDKASELSKLGTEFAYCGIWSRFHLHCLVSSLRLNKPIYPEPLELILEGLRSAVNTYALTRRILDILVPAGQPKAEQDGWDDEDEELLAEATRDVLVEPV